MDIIEQTIADYLAANGKYMSEDDIIVLERIAREAPDAWPAIVNATRSMGGDYPGIGESIVITHETLADFDVARTNHWRERGMRSECAFGGFDTVVYANFQFRKGAPRTREMTVINVGPFRVTLT